MFAFMFAVHQLNFWHFHVVNLSHLIQTDDSKFPTEFQTSKFATMLEIKGKSYDQLG